MLWEITGRVYVRFRCPKELTVKPIINRMYMLDIMY